METFSALLALCEKNLSVSGGLPSQKPVTQSFDDFFDLRLNERLTNHRDTGDLRRDHAHYDVTVVEICGAIYAAWFGCLPLSRLV